MQYVRFLFFIDTATTEICTLSLHDALPISGDRRVRARREAGREGAVRGQAAGDDGGGRPQRGPARAPRRAPARARRRSEEHTSELQSRQYLVCRLLLEKKNNEDVLDQPPQH